MDLTNSIIPRKTFRKIRFVTESANEIRRKAVVKIDKDEPYDKGRPVKGGLFDPRMGVVEAGEVCATCKQGKDDVPGCPGHPGYIELARAVYDKQFLPQIKKVLNCVCPICSEILLSLAELRDLKTGRRSYKRLDEIYKMSISKKFCPRCRIIRGENIPPQPKYFEDPENYIVVGVTGPPKDQGIAKFLAEKELLPEEEELDELEEAEISTEEGSSSSEEEEDLVVEEEVAEIEPEEEKKPVKETKRGKGEVERFPAEKALIIFQAMTNNTIALLGYDPRFTRPENFILSSLRVCPPAVRPTVTPKAKQRREDDLTEHLKLIIKTNGQLKANIELSETERVLIQTENNLTDYISKMIDNKKKANQYLMIKGRDPLSSITDRLGHKIGRLRGNLEGKRVNFSARSVISPDPNLDIDEVGVPYEIAMNNTKPIVVTKENKEFCYQLLYNGEEKYPGANFLVSQEDGKIKRIKNVSNIYDIVLAEGDVLERHLLNGDVVVFNRQPTLHRQSMLGMRCRILPGRTFRLNPSSCNSFNADFDAPSSKTCDRH